MKDLLLCVALLWLAGCVRTQEQKAIPLMHFQEANFGVRFNHTTDISTEYNPHGGADRVLMSWKGNPIGGLKIGSLPPKVSEEMFIAAGKNYYQEKYDASSIVYRSYTNQHRYRFHHIKAEAVFDGKNYVIERFVHLQDPKAARPDLDPLQSLLGPLSFSFEFMYRKDDSEEVGHETMTVIDSFRIEKGP